MKPQCAVAGCEDNHYGLGLCHKHYQRLKKGADVHAVGRYERSLEERFRAKLGPKDPFTGCIEWAGRRAKDGYGRIDNGKQGLLTHRYAWELKHGPIPEGLNVLHKCDNPPCCNDEHLFLGTLADNNADRDSKGRQVTPRGESCGTAKLTDKDVIEIRRRLSAGEAYQSIASAFQVSRSCISRIKLGVTWAHLNTNNSKPP